MIRHATPILAALGALTLAACATNGSDAEAYGDGPVMSCAETHQRCMDSCMEAEVSFPDRGGCQDACFDRMLSCEANERRRADTGG